METQSTFFERTAGAVRSQLSNHSARHYGYKASEMILIYRNKIYDRGTWWVHLGSQREQGPSVWACTGGLLEDATLEMCCEGAPCFSQKSGCVGRCSCEGGGKSIRPNIQVEMRGLHLASE